MTRTLFQYAFYVIRRVGVSEFVRQAAIEAETSLGTRVPEPVDAYFYEKSRSELAVKKADDPTIEELLDEAFSYRGWGAYRSIEPLQIREELRELLEEIDAFEPETVMEIGTARGGTFYLWCRLFDSASKFISVDLPGGDFGGGYPDDRIELFEEFSDATKVFVRGDSHAPETRSAVEAHVPDSGVDFLFIDGDHRYDGVKADFEDYRPFLSDDAIVVFHDVVPNPYDPDVEVARFWREIEDQFSTEEIVASPEQEWGGFGVVRL